MTKRPSRADAERVIANFLRESGVSAATPTVFEDGADGWAFFLHPCDTTSYVHPDLNIEWYGTQDHGDSAKGCTNL